MTTQREKQSNAQNINQEIDTKTWIIYGKMRNGKTLCSIGIGIEYYPRIYSNFQIYHDGLSIVNFIETYEQIKRIRFSYTPGVLIIDEAGINANSKDSFSKDNRLLQEVLFLAGKKNLSVVWIAQRFESIDVNARALADIIIECKKIRRKHSHPIFICTKQKQRGSKLEFIAQYEYNPISYYSTIGISYNTLEESKLGKTKDTKEAKNVKNILIKN